MGTDDVFVFEFTRTPEAFRDILMNDGVLRGIADELSNSLAGQVGPHVRTHGPHVFVRPTKYHQLVRFLTEVGVWRMPPPFGDHDTRFRPPCHQVWATMPPRFVIVDAELGSWVELLVASLPKRHNVKLRHKVLVCLGMVPSHFELQDYLAHPSHECVAGHLLTWA